MSPLVGKAYAVLLPLALVGVTVPTRAPAQDAFAIVGASVVPMDRERTLRDQTVVVRDGRIVALGPRRATKIPDGVRTIDGRGRGLIPGLAEMHAHIHPDPTQAALNERILALFALHGVTTVRGMLDAPHHLPLREQAERGAILSPRIVTTGPSLNGTSVPTVEAAVRAVTEQRTAGYDRLKIHPGLQREVFDALAATADRVGIRFAGHVPLDVGVRRALEARYWSIDHLDGFLEGLAGDAPATAAESGFFGGGEPAGRLAERPELRWWPREGVAPWRQVTASMRGDALAAQGPAFLAARARLIRALHRAGVRFLLGSDAPQVWNVPGVSAHQEFGLLVELGFTPYEALCTATRNVAEHLGRRDAEGTIAVGKRADLVLLEADPLRDIAATRRIAGVSLGGRWLGADEDARRLEALEVR